MIRRTVPVTLLAGFLGSGKTTLINRLLRESHGRRFAVIENEFGEIGLDADLLIDAPAETIVQLANGCVCCSVRGDLAKALGDLVAGRRSGTYPFDQVLIEASGMADPGPIARLFLSETALLEHFHLDGVVSLADALRGDAVFDDAIEAQAQIACADRILISKPDLAKPEVLERFRTTLVAMNASAEIDTLDVIRAPWGEVFERLLDVRGYQFDRVRFTIQEGDPHSHAAHHSAGVASVAFEADEPLKSVALTEAFAEFDRRFGRQIWRIKGVLDVLGSPQRIVVQGVQGLLQANPGLVWRPFEPRRSRLVFIGRGLDRDWMLERLRACQATASAA